MLSFSVVTCTWNSLPYLQDCIRSVQDQSSVEVEQVFVDGGSTDGTLELIEATTVPHRCIHGVRGGISNAMNQGLVVARNDVVVHLHGDDYFLHGNVLRRVAEIMESTGAQWVCGRIVSDLEGQLVPSSWRMPRYSRKALLKRNFIAHPATFIRRSLFDQVGGFSVGLRYAMDYDMWLRLSMLVEPFCTEERFTAFRRHANSASTANALAAFQEDQWVRREHLAANHAGALSRWSHELRHCWRRWRLFGLQSDKGANPA